MSPSPDKMFIERSGMSIRPDNEPTATASVGPKAAPKAKQAANGKVGKIICRVQPTPTKVINTPKKAKKRIIPKFFIIAFRLISSPSLNKSGAIIITKNTSGSNSISCPILVKPIRTPTIICTIGSGMTGTIRLNMFEKVIDSAKTMIRKVNSILSFPSILNFY